MATQSELRLFSACNVHTPVVLVLPSMPRSFADRIYVMFLASAYFSRDLRENSFYNFIFPFLLFGKPYSIGLH